MPVPDLCHGRVGQRQEQGNGQLGLSGQLPAYLRIGRLASTVSVERTASRAASGLVSAATVKVSRGDERAEQLALAELLRHLLLVHHLQSILSSPWEDF
jgi:hypothetical protein